MENIIWSRIDSMLDAIPVAEKNQTGSGKNYNGYSRWVIISVAAIIIVIICIILIKKKQHNTRKELALPSTQSKISVADSTETILPFDKQDKFEKVKAPPQNSHNSHTVDSVKNISINFDSLNIQPVIQDSTTHFVTPPALIKDNGVVSSKDSAAYIKKPRGIKGISDSSYRILPVKKN
jgi:hypothetical protein